MLWKTQSDGPKLLPNRYTQHIYKRLGKNNENLYLMSTYKNSKCLWVLALSYFIIYFFNLFIFYLWLCWVFVAARELSVVAANGGYSSLRCAGFSLRWLLLLQSTGSRRAGFSSCGSRAWLLRGMWDLPGAGLEPVSPALAGGFLTTAPPGKPLALF